MDSSFYEGIKRELTQNILPYWEKYSRDTESGGFYAAIDNNNVQNKHCNRSIVMTSRYLWTYSAAARLLKRESYLDMADYAFQALKNQYTDTVNGGMYWMVSPVGLPVETKKQIYGEAFALYGLCEYAAALYEIRKLTYPATVVMDRALALYSFLERYARDRENGGYLEALDSEWHKTDSCALSDIDLNCAKSMNTNLHVLEAYTNLYRTLEIVYPEQQALRGLVGKSISDLLYIMTEKILTENGHLGLYFNADWSRLDAEISYGHDIEASWLIWEAANEIGDDSLLSSMRPVAIKMAQVSLNEGFDKSAGALENTLNNGIRDRSRIWWNQAEALNGFYNAWELTGGEDFKVAFKKEWNWISENQIDKQNGDWFNTVGVDCKPVLTEDKGGNWKTSYHNSRCCMELLRRAGYGE